MQSHMYVGETSEQPFVNIKLSARPPSTEGHSGKKTFSSAEGAKEKLNSVFASPGPLFLAEDLLKVFFAYAFQCLQG